MTNGFWQAPNGDYSHGRLIGTFLVVSAVLMSLGFMYIAVKFPKVDLIQLATAIGLLFGTIAGSALLSLFGHKRTESKTSK